MTTDCVAQSNYPTVYTGACTISTTDGQAIGYVSVRHAGKSNVLWTDGHVSAESGGKDDTVANATEFFADEKHWKYQDTY